jgi:U4/U6.U5 tri-snRNP-associated protein 2
VELLQWLLNALHARLKKGKTSIISSTFQGHMTVLQRKLPPTADMAELAGIAVNPNDEQYKEAAKESPFMFLTLDLPPTPLFQDANKQNIIAQVPLFELLQKFDGVTEKEYKTYKEIWSKRFQLNQLPDYIVICIRRFTKNTFFTEKNSTIVNFPVKNIDMRDYLQLKADSSEHSAGYRYDLVANIVHDGLPGAGKGTYRCHVLHKGTEQWYEMQDLHVSETLPQMITLTESYIQIWERQKTTALEAAS